MRTTQQGRKLARFNLTSQFEIVVVLDEVSPRKYSLDTFEMAARKAGVNGSSACILGTIFKMRYWLRELLDGVVCDWNVRRYCWRQME